MTPTCPNALPTKPWHASDEAADDSLVDLLPDLDQSIDEFLYTPGLDWKTSNALVHDVPEVFDGVKVW